MTNRSVTHSLGKWNLRIFKVIGIVIGLALGCSVAFAQSGAGSIQGTVTDSSSAVVPGALIKVVNQATGVTVNTKSNSVGFYLVPDLFSGTYEVSVTASGMKTYTQAIQLLVAQSAVINIILDPGAVTQKVVVSGNDIQLVTTDSGTLTSTLENQRINQLPMNGRVLSTLVQMTVPGMAGGRLNGGLTEATEWSIDGVTTLSELNGADPRPQQQLIDPDTVQEVTVEASSSNAQFATPGTAIISTKSGTNSVHGTFFETIRNNVIGVAKSRSDPSNLSAPHLVRNEFGGSAGGPIILPHLYDGRNKSFWFIAYERYSLAQSVSHVGKVPTMAMRQGDYSGLTNSAGVLQTIFDPSTTATAANCPYTNAANPYCRAPFLNNRIPAGGESPLAKVYYALVPQPTTTANPLIQNNLTEVDPNFTVEPQITLRLDHSFNEKNRAFLKYSQNIANPNSSGGPRSVAADGIPANAALGSANYVNTLTTNYLSTIGYTHIFSPTFFAETLATQQWWNQNIVPGAASNVNYESALGLPNNFGTTGFPAFTGPLFALGTTQAGHNEGSQIISNLDENLTKVKGRNQMQFGVRFRHERIYFNYGAVADSIALNNLPTALYQTSSGANYSALANTGHADASLFLGSAASYSVVKEPPLFHAHQNQFNAYFQDNYHLSRNLTVNLGLRYEAHPAIWIKNGLISSFDLKNDALVLGAPISTLIAEGYTTQPLITNLRNIGVKFETAADAGLPNSVLKNYDLLFLPRAGIAYQFGGKYGTVIRGGYGRYVFPTPMQNGLVVGLVKNSAYYATYAQSYTLANQAIDALPNELLRYNDPAEFGVMGGNTANVVDSSSVNADLPGLTTTSVASNWTQAIETQTNFTIEQPLKGNSVLQVSWVWAHGTNLDTLDYYNKPLSLYQWEMATGTTKPTGGASVIGTPQQNTYAATALGPYDQTTWGNNQLDTKTGWSNFNSLEINYQRLFHHGVAYQVIYGFSKALRVGGDAGSSSQGLLSNAGDYPGGLGTLGAMTSPYGTVFPGNPIPARPSSLPVWADYHAMDKYQWYQLDSAIPVQSIRFNGIVDLPFGRGKRFLGNTNRFLNEVVGGFQLAGDGSITSQIFQPPAATYWGQTSPLKVYKHKHPITDCRSGICYKEYLWYNGYLAPTVTTGVAGSTCTSNCVSGLPADYVPYQTWVDNTPGTTNYLTNNVVVTLSNGKQVTVPYDAGPQGANYTSKKWLNGPTNWTADASLFKVVPITERLNLRFNIDAFNLFNVQGYTNPDVDGTEKIEPGGIATSYNTPRQIQLTMRLTF